MRMPAMELPPSAANAKLKKHSGGFGVGGIVSGGGSHAVGFRTDPTRAPPPSGVNSMTLPELSKSWTWVLFKSLKPPATNETAETGCANNIAIGEPSV
jgi:hypothetical protein